MHIIIRLFPHLSKCQTTYFLEFIVRWSKLLYIFCFIPQYVNDCDDVPKPVGYHWQSLPNNMYTAFIQFFISLVTLFMLVCHTVLIKLVTLFVFSLPLHLSCPTIYLTYRTVFISLATFLFILLNISICIYSTVFQLFFAHGSLK